MGDSLADLAATTNPSPAKDWQRISATNPFRELGVPSTFVTDSMSPYPNLYYWRSRLYFGSKDQFQLMTGKVTHKPDWCQGFVYFEVRSSLLGSLDCQFHSWLLLSNVVRDLAVQSLSTWVRLWRDSNNPAHQNSRLRRLYLWRVDHFTLD